MKRPLLGALIVLLVASGSSAIVDQNENGISDLWERLRNNGELFPETFDPQADPDGDGWSNAEEAAAGSNPFDPNPPAGLIRPDVVQIPAVLSVPDLEGNSHVITPQAVTVTWPTLVGKHYTLLFSPDLSQGSWIEIGDPFIGNGSEVTYGFEINDSDKRFWRVAVTDVDTDGDGLSDAEGHEIGSGPGLADSDGDGFTDFHEHLNGTDIWVADRDNDGLPDEWEILHGMDPDDDGSIDVANGPGGDFDIDGTTNSNEFQGRTDPADINDFPPRFYSAARRSQYQFATGASTNPNYNGLVCWATWIANPPSNISVPASPMAPSAIGPDLATKITYPNELPTSAFKFPDPADILNAENGSYIKHNFTLNGVASENTKSTLEQPRLWMKVCANQISSEPRKVPFFYLVQRRTYGCDTDAQGNPVPVLTNGEHPEWVIESSAIVNFEFDANSDTSKPLDLDTQLSGGNSNTWTIISFRLLPVEFKKMWETKNKANQIWNPTKKDDPATTGQQPNAVGQLDGVPRNKLYAVIDPVDGKYKVTVELGLPQTFRTKFYAATYVGETKVADSDKAFTDEGLCNLEFAHSGASGDIADFAIRVGYDANNSTTLESTEQVKLLIYTTSAKNATGEAIVLGTNADRYADAIDGVDDIVDGDWTSPGWATDLVLPHAKRFLQIFRDGNFSGLAVGMQPSSSRTVGFDAFSGLFCEWLTHNSGVAFSDDGVANIPEYTWDKSKSASQLVSHGKQIKDAINAHFTSLDARVRSDFENQPVGTVRYYPSAEEAYDLTHNHESPAWVTRTSVLFHNLWQIPPLPMGDDLNGTIGRGRLSFHKVRYRVERRPSPGPQGTTAEELNVTAETTGEVWDLYDWNHGVTGAAQNPAVLQIGFGKGAYGSNRDRGKIYLTHIPFDDIYDIRQIPTWP